MMTTLLLVQVVLLQEFRPESLWRSGNVRPALRRKVHQVPVRPPLCFHLDTEARSCSSPPSRLTHLLWKLNVRWFRWPPLTPLAPCDFPLTFVRRVVGWLASPNQ